MAINRQKISQMTPKGSDLDATDLLEVSVDTGSGYETRSITGAEVFGYVPYTGATQDVDLGEFELKAGQLTLDTSPTGTAAVGTTRWNNTLGSSETTLKGGSVILKNGVDLVARVVNKVTPNATLTKAAYQAVRVSGAQGQRLAVAYAQANNDNNSADTIGLVTETIATNQEGFIITVGHLEEINTTGSLQGETWSDGDVLYLSSVTPGAITNIKPTAETAHIVVIGYVEYAHVNNGKIYVKIMNGWELDELHNVYINTGTLANNDALIYESSTQLWKNKTIATALGYTPAPINITTNQQAVTSYTLALTDAYKLIEINSGLAATVTIPTNTLVPFPTGTQILISGISGGVITIAGAVGVTIYSSGGKTKLVAQYSIATLIKRSTNEWYLAGDLTT
jgi:nitrogen fixation protein